MITAVAVELERHRTHLRAVALRILGSAGEAEDALQETWLRASRAAASGVDNPRGWLTTILSRVCFDMLRARRRSREIVTTPVALEHSAAVGATTSRALEIAEHVSLALQVVLERLGPAERVAFVLHDLFGLPFDDIAAILARSPVAAKKLASRARQRVQRGATPKTSLPLRAALADGRVTHDRQNTARVVAEAFLAATRAGDIEALVALLAPDVVRRADASALRRGAPRVVRGARKVAKETSANAGLARHARVALVDGQVGVAVAPRGHLRFVLALTIEDGRIAAFEVIGDRARISGLVIEELPP
ncbi:MAG: sigma-70 family RNA polymerase sigma factor [Polyangiales bacterium]